MRMRKVGIVLFFLVFLGIVPNAVGDIIAGGCGMSCCDGGLEAWMAACDPGHEFLISKDCCSTGTPYPGGMGTVCNWTFPPGPEEACKTFWLLMTGNPLYSCVPGPGCDYPCWTNESCGYSIVDFTSAASDTLFFNKLKEHCNPPESFQMLSCGHTLIQACTSYSPFGVSYICGATHLACVDESCQMVAGTGQNECESNNDCRKEHMVCNNEQCRSVSGSGPNQCLNNSDCAGCAPICPNQHAECNQSAQCVIVQSPGINACASSFDCQSALCQTNENCPPGEICCLQGQNTICKEPFCDSNADCSDDGNPCTIPVCQNPGACDAQCIFESIPGCYQSCQVNGDCNAGLCCYQTSVSGENKCLPCQDCTVTAKTPIQVNQTTFTEVGLLNVPSMPLGLQIACGNDVNQTLLRKGLSSVFAGKCGPYETTGSFFVGGPNGFDIPFSYSNPTGQKLHCDPFEITVEPNSCGNGVIGPGEQCGEPGLLCPLGKSCNTVTCQCYVGEPYCGDGTVQPNLGEQCDPPQPSSPECGGAECKGDCTCAGGIPPKGIRLLVVSTRIEPSVPPLNSKIQKVVVLVRNVGDAACEDGTIKLKVMDADNKVIESIPVLNSLQFGVGAGKEYAVEFQPGPDTSGLESGAYGLLVNAYCTGVFQDEKTVFFSLGLGGFQEIPETGLTAALVLLAVVAILLFRSKDYSESDQ